MNDGGLLREYVEIHSEAAFTQLVERHLDLVYATALRQVHGNAENAKDVTQKVFIRLARKARSLLGHPVLAGWLYRATCLEGAAWQRAEWRRAHRERMAGLQSEWSGVNEAMPDWERLKPVIDDAMLDLNEQDRLAILLRFFAGRRLSEIGSNLGLGENAARMRVDRAMEKLRTCLARRGVASSSGALAVALAANTAQGAPAGFAAAVVTAAVSAGAAPVGLLGAAVDLFLMSKFQLAVAGAALALLAGGVGWELRQGGSLQHELAVERLHAAGLQGEARQPQARYTAGNRPLSAGGTSVSPANRDAIRTMKAISDHANAALYRRLRLPAADLEQLKELLAETEIRVSQAMRIAREAGLAEQTLAEQRQIRTLASQEANEAIRRLLGDEGYRYFENYDRTSMVRGLFSSYTDEMQLIGDPLTDPQVDRLVDLLQSTLGPALDQLRDEGGFDLPDSTMTVAATFLSPRQLHQLEGVRDEWSARRRITTLNRVAAGQGKLELNEQSARDYPGSPVAKD